MNKTPYVACVGELIVDFISTTNGVTLERAPAFGKLPGGACANVAVGIARLGVASSFFGKVGSDSFGRFLVNELRRRKVDTRGLVFDGVHKTRLAFVSKTRSGERDFEFWEEHPADEQLRKKDVLLARITGAAVVHLSSFLLLREPSRSTVFGIARAARREGCTVSFDPNIRFSVWPSRAEARSVLMKMTRLCSILRLNEEEACFLSGRRSVDAAATWLLERGPELVAITLGSNGAMIATNGARVREAGIRVKAVDTTGCGDAFLAGVLSELAWVVNRAATISRLSPAELRRICAFGNAAGAITAMREGGIPALPDRRSVLRCLRGKR